ncbi:glycosyltransferase family 61 protein [Brevibacillus sp. GCM10020057]|uniref:glycosyltransferase family 61 protein n=1 Tax=Brevibacillus sp. GCM10020057 TaxID=3317327 RepID=UPI0036451D56
MHNSLRPSGYYETTQEWARKTLDDATFSKRYVPFPYAPTVFRSPPKSVESKLHPVFEWCMNTKPGPQFIAAIPMGRVAGRSGGVISPDNKLLWDVSIESEGPEKHSVFTDPLPGQKMYVPGNVAVLTSYASHNYYHWLYDVIARIYLLRRSGIPIHKYILNGAGEQPFQSETLAALGIAPKQRIVCRPNVSIQAENLIVSSMPGFSGHPPKWACHFIKSALQTMRRVPTLPGFERLYISRAHARYRKVKNEPQLIGLLAKYGFRMIQLERLSVYDQAKLFSSAQVIVSPHGAGLANLTFCRPGTKVLEIYSPKYVNPLYYVLSNQMELDYSYVIGQGYVPGEHAHMIMDDITVDLSHVQQMLANMLRG